MKTTISSIKGTINRLGRFLKNKTSKENKYVGMNLEKVFMQKENFFLKNEVFSINFLFL